jgi:tetratricopeptide (TPR) repeat protein
LRWRYRVHEQILPAVRRLGGEVCFTDVVIHHVGYQDPALRSRKLQRDLRLLQLENAEQPDDAFTLFNLGALYHEQGRTEEALPLLWRSLERSHPTDSIVRKLYALLVQCHRQQGQAGQALAACRAGRSYYPEDAELLFQEGLILRGRGEHDEAEACFLRLLDGREAAHFASIDTGLTGYKARHNLAALYQESGRGAEAEALWRQALAEQPEFAPAWLGLGELCLAQGRWPEFDEAVGRLESTQDGLAEAAVLRARGYLARQEFATARHILEDTINRAPRQLWPRVILSHALLQEGRDWDAAERALLDVLALDPGNAGARQNLAVLLRQQGRLTDLAV